MTTTTDRIADALVAGFRSSIQVSTYGDGHLLVLPQSYASGALLSLLISSDDDVVAVSDRGMTAEQLEDAGVDITRPAVRASWKLIQASTGLIPAMGTPEWELTASGTSSHLSVIVQAVADAAMRADGLRALSRTSRRRTFGERVISTVGDRDLPVMPHAALAGKYGASRRVTCRIEVAGGLYVQALSGRDADARVSAFDHAHSLFANALPEKEHRMCVLEGNQWEAWQTESLRDLSRVAQESKFGALLDSLAA